MTGVSSRNDVGDFTTPCVLLQFGEIVAQLSKKEFRKKESIRTPDTWNSIIITIIACREKREKLTSVPLPYY